MTGRDVPTRQKTLSVAFSVIMVLSMVAIGAAGFAGSAAAGSNDIDAGSASFVSETANSGDTGADHAVRVNVSGTNGQADLNGGSIGIEYNEDVNLDSLSVAGSQTVGGTDDVEVFVGGTEVASSAEGGSGEPDNIQTTTSSITIPLNGDASADASSVDNVTIVISGDSGVFGSGALNNPSGDNALEVNISNDNTDPTAGSTDGFSTTPQMDSDAPISAELDGSSGTQFFHTLESVVDSGTFGDELTANTAGDTVTVNDDLNVTADPAGVLFDGLSAQTNVTIQGDGSNPTIAIGEDSTGNSITPYVSLNGQSGVTVDGITFEEVETTSLTAVSSSGSTTNTTVSSNTFQNFTGTTVDLQPGSSSGDVDTVTVSGSTFNGDAGGAISVDLQSMADGSATDALDIDSNTIDFADSASAAAGIDVDVDAGSTDTNAITISSNDVNATGNSNNMVGIQLANDNAFDAGTTTDISDGTLDGVSTGILEGGNGLGDFLNVTSVTMEDIDQNTPRGIDLTGSPGATITVDDLTVDSSPNANAIYLDDSSDLTVTGSSINDTDVGVQVDSANNNVIVSGTSIDNTGTHAIDINNPGADVTVNESSSIDQGATGIEVTGGSGNSFDFNGITVNGTTDTGVADTGAGLFVESLGNSDDAVNVTDSTFTSNEEALNVSDGALSASPTEQVNVHFNTFEDNVNAVGVGDINDGDVVINMEDYDES